MVEKKCARCGDNVEFLFDWKGKKLCLTCYNKVGQRKEKEKIEYIGDKRIDLLDTVASIILVLSIIGALMFWLIGLFSGGIFSVLYIAIGFIALFQGIIVYALFGVLSSDARCLLRIEENIIRFRINMEK